jgi:hypothetical protein|tara:strand:- start:233 stop:439 length:207 start_codon:yes stop_codon:yes gene_type:complete
LVSTIAVFAAVVISALIPVFFANSLMIKLNGAAHFCRTLRDYLSLPGHIPVSHFCSAGLRSLFVMLDV